MVTAKSGRITETDRRTVIRHLATYLLQNIGSIDQQHKIAAAKCLAYHFPCLKDVNDDKFDGVVSTFVICVSIYSDTYLFRYFFQGLIYKWLDKSLQNMKIAEKKRNEKANTESDNDEHQAIEVGDANQLKDDLLFLKTEIVTADNIEDFKARLMRTCEHRKEMMFEMKMDLPDVFSYIFTHPELVGIFFSSHFN